MSQLTIPVYHSPSIVRAAHDVGALLEEMNYSSRAREEIVTYIIRNSTPTGCPWLCEEDEAAVSEAFEESFTPIDYSDPAWGEPEPAGFSDPDPAVEFELPAARPVVRSVDGSIEPMPVSGGAPDDDEVFIPSEEDWTFYREHFDRVEPLWGYE